MENFIYSDKFYSDMDEFLEDEGITEDNCKDFPPDRSFECFDCELEKVVVLNAEWIEERIDSERYPEESDRMEEKLRKALAEIDFTKANELMPSLWYPTRKKFSITMADIIQHFS